MSNENKFLIKFLITTYVSCVGLLYLHPHYHNVFLRALEILGVTFFCLGLFFIIYVLIATVFEYCLGLKIKDGDIRIHTNMALMAFLFYWIAIIGSYFFWYQDNFF